MNCDKCHQPIYNSVFTHTCNMLNPTHQPPSAEAVNAAFELVDDETCVEKIAALLRLTKGDNSDCIHGTAARILAAHARAKEAEVADLRSWKDSQMAVEREWECQQVGKLIGAPLWSSIRRHIQPWVESQIAEVARLREALEKIAGQKLSDELDDEQTESADFEFGYDEAVREARKALTGEAGA